MEQDELNNMMSRRYRPATPEGLAERIIHAAISNIPQEWQRPRNVWAELRAMFALPHPSVVVAMSVIIGVVVGIQAGDSLIPLGQDWSSFLDINEGGWL